jgi:hypothetical protein
MNEESSVVVCDARMEWSQPNIIEIAVEQTEGLGGGGPDFGSELS